MWQMSFSIRCIIPAGLDPDWKLIRQPSWTENRFITELPLSQLKVVLPWHSTKRIVWIPRRESENGNMFCVSSNAMSSILQPFKVKCNHQKCPSFNFNSNSRKPVDNGDLSWGWCYDVRERKEWHTGFKWQSGRRPCWAWSGDNHN